MEKINVETVEKYNNFWLIGCLLVVLLGVTLSRDITRPFTGLHSWAQASGAWVTRSHVKYGLEYTKGVSTWAVGQPPVENPKRYWDHPQLSGLIASVFMRVFGINEWSSRIVSIIVAILTLLIFLNILRHLADDLTALLSGLILVLMPITGYFSLGGWASLMGFGAIWFYFKNIGVIGSENNLRKRHKVGLALTLFFALQFGWTGFFFAFGIGVHYVFRCIFRKQLPNWPLLAILVFVPALSLLVNFTVMAGGYDWDINKIRELYKWRSAKGEMQQMQGFDWSAWNAKFWEFAQTNFSTIILVLSITYLTLGQLFVFMEPKPDAKTKRRSRQFPQFMLFFVIAMSQLFILKGCLWRHQSWERPFAPLFAISTALAILLVGDIFAKLHQKLRYAAIIVLVVIVSIFCVVGTNHYYSVRWQPQAKIDMFKKLNAVIPADKRLLSFEDFIVNQHKSKGGFIRPEIAWYLDREIDTARTLQEIQEKAKTGNYPYYLMPMAYYDQQTAKYLNQLSVQLRQIYKFEYVSGVAGVRTKDGKFLKAGMNPYMIFDLTSARTAK